MKAIKKILCVTDLSRVSLNAERAALRLSVLLNAHLTILSCGDSYLHEPNRFFDENMIEPEESTPHSDVYEKSIEQKKRETTDHFQRLADAMGIKQENNWDCQVKLENEVIATLDFLKECKEKFDFLIVGKPKRQLWEKVLFGSPAKEICDETKMTTLLMPSEPTWANWQPQQILVASALNASSHHAEKTAADLASHVHGKATFFHVVDLANLQIELNISHIFPLDYLPVQLQEADAEKIKNEIQTKLQGLVSKWKASDSNADLDAVVASGSVGHEILKFLSQHKEINLLVMGSRGQNALKKFFLGSNTDILEESCLIPLLVVQQPFIESNKHV